MPELMHFSFGRDKSGKGALSSLINTKELSSQHKIVVNANSELALTFPFFLLITSSYFKRNLNQMCRVSLVIKNNFS